MKKILFKYYLYELYITIAIVSVYLVQQYFHVHFYIYDNTYIRFADINNILFLNICLAYLNIYSSYRNIKTGALLQLNCFRTNKL